MYPLKEIYEKLPMKGSELRPLYKEVVRRSMERRSVDLLKEYITVLWEVLDVNVYVKSNLAKGENHKKVSADISITIKDGIDKEKLETSLKDILREHPIFTWADEDFLYDMEENLVYTFDDLVKAVTESPDFIDNHFEGIMNVIVTTPGLYIVHHKYCTIDKKDNYELKLANNIDYEKLHQKLYEFYCITE